MGYADATLENTIFLVFLHERVWEVLVLHFQDPSEVEMVR